MIALESITGRVIYNPAYTYKFQLKTTYMAETSPFVICPNGYTEQLLKIYTLLILFALIYCKWFRFSVS